MNDYQMENSTIRTSIRQIKDKNLSTNKSSKININIAQKIKKNQLFVCLKGCFYKLSLKWGICLSKFSLLAQFLLFLIPFSIFLYISIYFIHYFGYERIFKFDYYYAVEKEYLNYLISDLDDIHFEISSKEMKSQFEDIDNIYFFEIYFKELVNMGLLEDENQKIFPNISTNSCNYYDNYDQYQIDNNINNIYTIPKEEAEQFIDNRTDIFSEIGKLYYYFLPIITYEAITKKTYINETFLIAYEFNDTTKEIIGDYLYFSFPTKSNEIVRTSNFFPTNTYISPQISINKTEHGEKYNGSFYKENWFIQQDYNYRLSANDNNMCSIIFSNLNYDYYGKLNKSNIISMQSYFHSNTYNKKYIINIIYYINQKDYKEENLEFSSFLLFNDSLEEFEIEKYSDNDTFLISKLNIAELTLSTPIKQYFHYGMYDKNNNFFKHGVSYDTIDLENLAEPLKYYKSLDDLNIDLRYFSSLYLYSSLFRKLHYNLTREESKDLDELVFINEENNIQNICKNINFSSYLNYLEEENIDCFDNNNLLYYSERGTEENIFNFNYNTMPYCICMPLYCLKNLEKGKDNIDTNDFEDIIKFPDKCQNNLQNYFNGINEYYKNTSNIFETILEINFGLNNINLTRGNIKDNIEDEFYMFKSLRFPQIPKIIIMIVTLVENSSIKELLSSLITKIDTIKSYYIIIELAGMLAAFIIANILIIIGILRISKVIFDYEKKHKNFLIKLESTNKEINLNKNNKNNFNAEKKLEKINYSNDNNLIKNIDKNIFKDNINDIYNIYISNDSPLLNDLSGIFLNYYKMTKEELVKISHETKKLKNEKPEIEENELFKFLRIISYFIPKFKLNVSMDYNFYLNSKLNSNYLKSITKGQNENTQLIYVTQSVIYELLSTEKIENCGLITNFHFKYITNINFNNKKENSSIKNSMFTFIENEKEDISNKNNNNEIFIGGDNKKDNNKIIWKERNKILDEFENNFENDDYLKKDKINSAFDAYLTNAYYKYINKIICLNSTSSSLFGEKSE